MTDVKVDNIENGQKANEEGGQLRLDPKVEAYLQELLKEKHILSTSAYPHASRLMQEGKCLKKLLFNTKYFIAKFK